MKQEHDTYTLDMHGTEEVITPDNSTTRPDKYRFYIETPDGVEIEWCGLTRKQARDMQAYTQAHHPSNVTRSGWEITR
jgi:hypothetical protein